MKIKNILFLSLIFLFGFLSYSQDVDSTKTAFKKGRWLTGLNGTISSTTTKIDDADVKTTVNNYGINIESGKFVKDRFLIGGILQINRSSSDGNFRTSTEYFFIGPKTNYYFMDDSSGSLFASFAIGYVRYQDETEIFMQESLAQEFSEGDGIGSILGLGYSYTINRSIAFDLSINANLFRVRIERESLPSENITTTVFNSSELLFSFGFNIILDDFFF